MVGHTTSGGGGGGGSESSGRALGSVSIPLGKRTLVINFRCRSLSVLTAFSVSKTVRRSQQRPCLPTGHAMAGTTSTEVTANSGSGASPGAPQINKSTYQPECFVRAGMLTWSVRVSAVGCYSGRVMSPAGICRARRFISAAKPRTRSSAGVSALLASRHPSERRPEPPPAISMMAGSLRSALRFVRALRQAKRPLSSGTGKCNGQSGAGTPQTPPHTHTHTRIPRRRLV